MSSPAHGSLGGSLHRWVGPVTGLRAGGALRRHRPLGIPHHARVPKCHGEDGLCDPPTLLQWTVYLPVSSCQLELAEGRMESALSQLELTQGQLELTQHQLELVRHHLELVPLVDSGRIAAHQAYLVAAFNSPGGLGPYCRIYFLSL